MPRSASGAAKRRKGFVFLSFMLPQGMLLHVVRNTHFSDNALGIAAIEELQRRLPTGWKVGAPRRSISPPDGAVDLRGPDGIRTRVLLEAKARLDPKGVYAVAALARQVGADGLFVIVSPYLSPSTRERLRAAEISHLDLTGNARIVVPKPGLYIETTGATVEPNRSLRPARSLRGPKAGRIVRALADRKRPPGVRELAAIAGINAGYVSRVLSFLDSEALIRRTGRGRIETVDWLGLLRRWAREAPLESRGEVRSYLDPRGLKAFLERLGKAREPYAVTGALAAARFAPVAPPRLAIVWMRRGEAAAPSLGLRPADSGANVLLVNPTDELVFEGATEDRGVRYAAPSQVAADLLTSPGRGPAEGEALLEWMRENEDSWRG